MTPDQFRTIALAQPEAIESAHMGKADFRVRKKIFATLAEADGIATLKLGPDDQAVMMSLFDAVWPASGAWGARGWTQIRLAGIDPDAMQSWMATAWAAAAPKTLEPTAIAALADVAASVAGDLPVATRRSLLARLGMAHRRLRELVIAEGRVTAPLRAQAGAGFYQEVPRLRGEVHDLTALTRVARHLFGESPA